MKHKISLAEAVDMTRRFREHRAAAVASNGKGLNLLPFSETFDRAAIDSLLAKPRCAAVRIYYGMDPELQIHAIVVAADENGNDLLPGETTTMMTEDEYEIIDRANRCPDFCPEKSPLNP